MDLLHFFIGLGVRSRDEHFDIFSPAVRCLLIQGIVFEQVSKISLWLRSGRGSIGAAKRGTIVSESDDFDIEEVLQGFVIARIQLRASRALAQSTFVR